MTFAYLRNCLRNISMCMLRLKPSKLTTCHMKKTRKKKSNYIYDPGVQHFHGSTQHLSILLNFLLIVLDGSQKIYKIKQ